MYHKADRMAVYQMFLDLCHVVGDIVYQRHGLIPDTKHPDEFPACGMEDHLPVGPGIICGSSHCTKIGCTFRRSSWSAGKLAVGKGDMVYSLPLFQVF